MPKGMLNGDRFDWSDERVARLRKMIADGVSSNAAGEALGCGKNAAIGKASRLGLHFAAAPGRPAGWAANVATSDQAPQSPAPSAKRKYVAKPKPPVATIPPLASAEEAVEIVVMSPPPVPVPVPAPVITPRSVPTCCWPIGEPRTRGFRFCDDPPHPGRPYCLKHCETAYSGFRRSDAA